MSKRYGRNQKRRHRELVKSIENERRYERLAAKRRELDLEEKLSVMFTLTEIAIDQSRTLYLSPNDGATHPWHQSERKEVELKKFRIRELVDRYALDRTNIKDYMSLRKDNIKKSLLMGLIDHVTVEVSEDEFSHQVMLEATVVIEPRKRNKK